jgi:hypothetical protein
VTTVGYLRYEVTYASKTAPGRHVWGWTDARKEVDRMLYAISFNSNMFEAVVIDRERAAKPSVALVVDHPHQRGMLL